MFGTITITDQLEPLAAFVINENCTLPASSAGAVSSYVGSGTGIQVFEGATALTYVTANPVAGQWTLGAATQNPAAVLTVGGYSGTGTTTATVAAHSAMINGTDVVTISYPITVVRLNGATVSLVKQQTVSKSRTGASGADAVVYWTQSSTAVLGKSLTNVFSPATVTFNSYTRTGAGAAAAYAGRFKIYENGSGTASYTSAADESSKVYTPTAGCTSIKCELYAAGATTTLLDYQGVGVALAGATGAAAISGGLTNEAVLTGAASNGTGYSLTSAGGTFNVYSGTTDVTTSATFAITGGTDGGTTWTKVQNGLTLTLNETTGVYTLSGASWTSDTESFTLTATYSGTTVTKTYTIGKSKQGVSAVSSVLTNESVALPATTEGAVTSYTGATTTMSVSIGQMDDSANWTYAATYVGCTCAEAATSRTQTVTSLTADVGTVTIVATKSGQPTQTKILTVVKAKAGTSTVMSDYFDAYPDAQSFAVAWETVNGATGDITMVSPADSVSGGRVVQFGNNSGNDTMWSAGTRSIPFDPNKLYRVTAVVRRLAGTGTVYLGVAGRDATDTMWVSASGANSVSGQCYCAALSVSPSTEWTTYVGYIKGFGATVGSNGSRGNPSLAAALHPNVRYIRPLLITNYNGVAGTTQVDSFRIDEMPPLAIQANGVNVMPAPYSAFLDSSLPPLYIGYCSVSLDTTVGVDLDGITSTRSLKVVSEDASSPYAAYAYLSTAVTAYNIRITPGKYWLLSGYARSNLAGAVGTLALRDSGGNIKYTPIFTLAAANKWYRVWGVIDLSTSSATSALVRVGNDNVSGTAMWFDNLMLEEFSTYPDIANAVPSAYQYPASGMLPVDRLLSGTLAASTSLTIGTPTTASGGIVLASGASAGQDTISVQVSSVNRVLLGYLGTAGVYGLQLRDSSGNITWDSTEAVGIRGNPANDNFNVGDSTTNHWFASSTYGSSNIAIGAAALEGTAPTSTRNYNIAIGSGAVRYATSNSYNIGIGYNAVAGNATTFSGSHNIGIGYRTLYVLTTGQYNLAMGYESLNKATTGGYNIAFGHQAQYSLTTGQYNVALGYQALHKNVSGSDNVAIGYQSGYYGLGDGNTLLGVKAGRNAAEIFYYNVAIGKEALGGTSGGAGQSNVAVGYRSMSAAVGTEVSYNTCVGLNSGANLRSIEFLEGGHNVAIGVSAGAGLDRGHHNTIVGSSTWEIVLDANYAPEGNTLIGGSIAGQGVAGSHNTIVGDNAGPLTLPGNRNTFLGYQAARGLMSGTSYALVLGLDYADDLSNSDIAIAEGSGYRRAYCNGSTGAWALSTSLTIGPATLATTVAPNVGVRVQNLSGLTAGNSQYGFLVDATDAAATTAYYGYAANGAPNAANPESGVYAFYTSYATRTGQTLDISYISNYDGVITFELDKGFLNTGVVKGAVISVVGTAYDSTSLVVLASIRNGNATITPTLTTKTSSTTVTFASPVTISDAALLFTSAGTLIGRLASAVSNATTGTLRANANVALTASTGCYYVYPTDFSAGVTMTRVAGSTTVKFSKTVKLYAGIVLVSSSGDIVGTISRYMGNSTTGVLTSTSGAAVAADAGCYYGWSISAYVPSVAYTRVATPGATLTLTSNTFSIYTSSAPSYFGGTSSFYGSVTISSTLRTFGDIYTSGYVISIDGGPVGVYAGSVTGNDSNYAFVSGSGDSDTVSDRGATIIAYGQNASSYPGDVLIAPTTTAHVMMCGRLHIGNYGSADTVSSTTGVYVRYRHQSTSASLNYDMALNGMCTAVATGHYGLRVTCRGADSTAGAPYTTGTVVGVYVADYALGAYQSVTTAYGVHVTAPTVAATNWGIYQDGASAANFFSGTVLIGSDTGNGVNKLQVTGSAYISAGLSLASDLTFTNDVAHVVSVATSTTTGKALTLAAGAAVATAAVTGTSHVGGALSLYSGLGSANTSTTNTSNLAAGNGGANSLYSGAGGDCIGVVTGAAAYYNRGGASGAVAVYSGAGGAASGHNFANTGGASGTTQIRTGAGGAATSAGTTNTGGAGGTLSILGGAGGAASGGTTNVGGAGSTLLLTAGAGGVGTQTGGAGGAITITTGAAGTTGDVNAGTLTLNAGIAQGTGTSTINIGTLTTAGGNKLINIGNATTTTTLTLAAQSVVLPSGATKVGNTTLTQGGSVTITLPTTTSTLVGKNTTDQLTNKTFGSNSYSTTTTLTIANDNVFLTAAAAWTLTLPAPTAGKVINLIRTDATAFVISVLGHINGVASTTNTTWFPVSTANRRVSLVSNGTTWYVLFSGAFA